MDKGVWNFSLDVQNNFQAWIRVQCVFPGVEKGLITSHSEKFLKDERYCRLLGEAQLLGEAHRLSR